ncbi:hypothetical protein [Hyphomicrobium sp. NDB2Meth4]|uniref:hypothetical protein n=1 Tax=Hyphomicrobium sp. NDB2Meth4 TaxID=1892846 RepID=UPI0009313D46|nr:hypothetical protein [Hyphomicrobium sp. NDB2Meth4]
MATTFDISDVPAADAADLGAAMQTLIENGRALVLLNGASADDLDAACAVLQNRHRTAPRGSLAAVIRFRHLIEVFATRRLQQLLLDTGYAAIAPAISVAACMRLNGHRGFNPQLFLLELSAALADNVIAMEGYRRDHAPREHRYAA